MWSSPYRYPSVEKPTTISGSLPSIQWIHAQSSCCFRCRSGDLQLVDVNGELTLEMDGKTRSHSGGMSYAGFGELVTERLGR